MAEHKICAFCLRPAKMSGEHVWADWIQKAFNLRKYVFRQIIHDADEVPHIARQWHTPSVNLKAHVVCENCNNTWMSDLENQNKSITKDMILSGYSLSLLPAGIATLAASAFKTAVIVDYMNTSTGRRPFADSYFRPIIRNRFRESLALPEGFQVWLAYFRSSHAASGRLWSAYFKHKTGAWKDFYFFTVTYAVGHLIFQALCPRWAKRTRRRRPLPLLPQEHKWHSLSVPMWPNDGLPVLWPPCQHFTDNSLYGFCDRWKSLPF